MGGLSSGPGPGICLLALLLACLAQLSQSAPVQEDNPSPQTREGYYDGSSSEISAGCYYNFQHYGEGDRIITNEPCLNCTCHNRMLMCYLRVCPFTKAIGQNCTIEKKPGQCCPLIICPEVPVQLLTSSTTTEHSESLPHRNQIGYGQYGTAVGHLDDYGCRINGEFYTNGAQIPGNIDKPCEVCYCIRNRTACIMQECTLQVEGCIPVYEEGLCCPVRYQCDYEYNYNAITTEQPRPTPGLILTTTTSGPFECQHDNKWYADGASVDTEDPCEHCYCMKGDIVCAVQECKTPFEKDGHNCTAMAPAPGKCCPDSYHCDGNDIEDESEPTFRQDRMHKFGENNANVTMSITSSTSSSDKQHGWHYGGVGGLDGTNDKPNREHGQDGTKKPAGKPGSDTDNLVDGQMIVTEGVPPTVGPLESGSHQMEGHHGEKPVSQGHGVNTDSVLTISQVIQSIIQNQTNLMNQNRLNMTMGRPQSKPNGTSAQTGGHAERPLDDKITFPEGDDLKQMTGVHGKPGLGGHVLIDEDGNPIGAHEDATELPEDYYGFAGGVPGIYAEHGGRPQTRPTGHKKPGSVAQGSSTDKRKPGTQHIPGAQAHGERPQIRPGVRPGSSTGADDTTETYQGMTELPEGFTGQPGSGRPHKRPVIHQRPGMDGTLVLTDDEGNPVEIYEGVTGMPEGFTGRPGSGVHTIFGEQGRPGTHKRPGATGGEGLTDEESVTGAAEGFTGRPESDGFYVVYDEHGRPHRRPIVHKRPGMTGSGVATSEDEGVTGKPGLSIFGEHGHTGRPRPGLSKRPGMTGDEGMTDEEGVTGLYEGVTGAPESDGTNIYYDEQGRPHRRPVVHKRPGASVSDIMTDESGSPVEGVTGSVEGVTGKPGSDGTHTLYGEHGHAGRPGTHKRPGMGGMTHETGATTEMFDSVTETPEGYTGQPGEHAIYGEHGHTGRPHTRPGVHTKPGMDATQVVTGEHGKPVEGHDGVTELPEGHTGRPEPVGTYIFYDEHGRPHKRPVVHKRPGATDEDGNPIEGPEGVTGSPEGFTGRPDSDEMALIYEVFYDKYGRPHKKPVTQKKPGEQTMTDELGKPSEEDATEVPEDYTGKPDGEVYYDQYGRPHKRPVVHGKPGDHGGVTEVPEDYTGKPDGAQEIYYDQYGRPHRRPIAHGKPDGEAQEIYYDQYGRPHRRPVVYGKPTTDRTQVMTDEHGKPIDQVGVTDVPEDYTGKPDGEAQEVYYDQYGRPHRRPVVHGKPTTDRTQVLTDEHGKPLEHGETTEMPEGQTTRPDGTVEEVYYDEFGRPHRRPVVHGKPVTDKTQVMTDEHGKPVDQGGVTDVPEDYTGKPGDEAQGIYYDQYGRPHRRPVVHGKPTTDRTQVLTDEHGKPVDHVGVTDVPEDYTGKPDGEAQEIYYDQYGRPHRRPIVHGKPVTDKTQVMTDEEGKPVDQEETTETLEGHTGKPDEVYYDEHGRPHKRPVTHGKPTIGTQIMTDEHGKPVKGHDGIPEEHTGRPESDVTLGIFGEHGHTGRPHKRPVVQKRPGVDGMTEGSVLEGVTGSPEGFTVSPDSDGMPAILGEHGHTARPHEKPMHAGPVGVTTDEDGMPVEGYEGTTETMEGFAGKPGHAERPQRPLVQKRPGMTDELGATTEESDVTETPEGYTGKPGSYDGGVIFGEHGHAGRPHKKPVVHGQPGMDGTETVYDEHGRPHKRPVIHKIPGMVAGSDILTDDDGQPIEGDLPEGHTVKPATDGMLTIFGEHGHTGRPQKRPVQTTPGPDGMSTDEEGKPVEGSETATDASEGQTGRPESDVHQVVYDQYGRPHFRPVGHGKPGAGVMTDEMGKPVSGEEETEEEHTGRPEAEIYEVVYDEHGRPHKRPVVHKRPEVEGADVMTDEDGNFIEQATKTPDESSVTEDGLTIYGESGRPHKRPVVHKKPGTAGESESTEIPQVMTETPEGHTTRPHAHDGTPVKKPVEQGADDVPEEGAATDEYHGATETPEASAGHPGSSVPPLIGGLSTKKPGVTDDEGATIEGATGKPDSDGMVVYYDENGRPLRRPVVHKQPGTTGSDVQTDEDGNAVEGVTGTPEDHTGKPESDEMALIYEVFYDKYGRPHKKPVTQKKPGEQVMTDELGKPLEQGEVTETLEGQTKKPEDEVHEVYYDQYGRPHKRPVVHGKPTVDGTPVMTDEKGKPVDQGGVTDVPEGQTTRPDGTVEEIYYDQFGRPHRRPVLHGKPATDKPQVVTDEKGQPVDQGGVTEVPEDYTGKPDDEAQEIYYDQHGRPHRRPIVHGKPVTDKTQVMTDEEGKPVDQEETTETLEGHTGKPDGEAQEVYYDQYGRPHRRPAVHGKPTTDSTQVLTDEHGKPVDHVGVTDVPEGQSTRPDGTVEEVYYDQFGRPHKRPVVHGTSATDKPQVMTDEKGKPVDQVGVTEVPEDYTGKPDGEAQEVYYDQYGRPHRRPVVHGKPTTDRTQVMTDEHGKPLEHGETTEMPEGQTTRPDGTVEEVYYDEFGRPHRRPVVHGKPVTDKTQVMTDEHGKPVEQGGVTEVPEDYTGKPDDEPQEIYYDQYGRPHRRPIVPGKPTTDSTQVLTDEHGKPVEHVGVTDVPEGQTTRPDGTVEEVYFDQFGRPHKRPVVHGTSATDKPQVMTDEKGKPVDHVGVTEVPEDYTGKPDGEAQEVYYDQYGRPHRRPVVHGKPTTDRTQVMTDEHGQPVGGASESPEHTGRPETETQKPGFDQHGRPVVQTPSVDGSQVSTDEHGQPSEEDAPAKPEDEMPSFFGEGGHFGRPQKPGPVGITIHEEGNPLEQDEVVTETPEDLSSRPESDSQHVIYDQFGRPHFRPTGHGKPGTEVLTDEQGKPVAGQEGSPEGQTDKPGTGTEEVVYDEHGVPHMKPGVQKKPETHLTDEEPEGVTGSPEGQTGRPESDKPHVVFETVYDEHGQPQRRPIHKEPGEEAATHKPTDGVSPVDHTGKPESEVTPAIFGEHGHTGRPHTKPSSESATTDEEGRPVEGSEMVTEVPEGQTGRPESDSQQVVYDQYGRPHLRPVIHGKPGAEVLTDEQGRPVAGHEVMTESPEGSSVKPEGATQEPVYDEHGRPQKRPTVDEKPDVDGTQVLTDERDKPVDGQSPAHTAKPEFDGSRPEDGQDRPVKKPGDQVSDDEHGQPVEAESPEDHTGRPAEQGHTGRPHVKPEGSDVSQEMEGQEGATGTPEGVTRRPGSTTPSGIFGEHGHTGRPHKKPGVRPGMTEDDDGAATEEYDGVTEGYTVRPGSTGEPAIFGEHGHSGRPHKRPVKPTKTGTQAPEDSTETAGEAQTGVPVTDEQGPEMQKEPETGHVTTGEKEGPIETHDGTTGSPEGHPSQPGHDDAQEPHKRPGAQEDTGDSHPTGVYDTVTGTPEEDGTGGHDQQGQRPVHRPAGEAHEGAEGPDKDSAEGEPATQSPEEGHTGKPTPSGVEIYYDESGRPHKRPVPAQPGADVSEVYNEVPEESEGKPTPVPDLFGEHGHAGRPQKRPSTKPSDTEEAHTTETPGQLPEEGSTGRPQDAHVHYDEQGRPHTRPVTGADGAATTQAPHDATEKPETHVHVDGEDEKKPEVESDSQVGTEKPEHDIFGEHGHVGRPQRPTIRPGVDLTGVMVDEGEVPSNQVGISSTAKPEKDGQPEGVTDEHPHKRPGVEEPAEGVTGTPEHEGHAGKPVRPGTSDDQSATDAPTGSEDAAPGTPKPGSVVDTSDKAPETEPEQDGENEIPGADSVLGEPEKDLPEVEKVPEEEETAAKPEDVHTQKRPEGEEATGEHPEVDKTEGSHPEKRPETDDTTATADGAPVLGYLPPKGSVTHKTPTETSAQPDKAGETGHVAGAPEHELPSKPVEPGTHDDQDEDDDSLVITTDESDLPDLPEEDHHPVVDKRPEGAEGDKPAPTLAGSGQPHPVPEADAAQPSDTKTKVPEESAIEGGEGVTPSTSDDSSVPGIHSVTPAPGVHVDVGEDGKPHPGVHGTTPGMGAPTDDFTTPGYGHGVSGVPVTEEDGVAHVAPEGHPTTPGLGGKPLGVSATTPGLAGAPSTPGDSEVIHIPGVNIIFDEHGRPHLVPTHGADETTPGLTGVAVTTPGTEEHGKPEDVAGQMGPTGILPGEEVPAAPEVTTHVDQAVVSEDGKPQVTPSPEGVSSTSDEGVTRVPGVSILFDQYGKPHLVPAPSGTPETEGSTTVGTEGVTDTPVDEDGKPVRQGAPTHVGTTSPAGDGKPQPTPEGTQPSSHEESHPTESAAAVDDGKPQAAPGGTRPGEEAPVTHDPAQPPAHGVEEHVTAKPQEAGETADVSSHEGMSPAAPTDVGVTSTPGVPATADKDGKPVVDAASPVATDSPVTGDKPSSTPEGTLPGVSDLSGSAPTSAVRPEEPDSTASTKVPLSGSEPAQQSPIVVTPASADGTTARPTHGHLPQLPIGYLPSFGEGDESGTKQPPMIDEGVHGPSSPFDAILDNLANVLRPIQTTEEPYETTEAHGEVPEEGSCYMDGVTYPNHSEVPPSSPCHTKCTCINSVIHCLSLMCPPVPEDVTNCTTVHEESSCCPTYICGNDVLPTFPIENHEGEPTPGVTEQMEAVGDTQTPAAGHEDLSPVKPVMGSTTRKPEAEGVTKRPTDEERPGEEVHAVEGAPEAPVKHDETQPEGEAKPQETLQGTTERPHGAVDGTPERRPQPGTGETGGRPQTGDHAEAPEESDKGTPLTERPEDDETHSGEPDRRPETSTSPEEPTSVDTASAKPGPTGIEPEEGAQHEPDFQAPTKTEDQSKPSGKPTERPLQPQSGYFPVSSDSGHPSTVLPPYFGTLKPGVHPETQRPESDDHVLGSDKPGDRPTGEHDKPVQGEEEPHKPGDEVGQSTTVRPSEQGKPGEPEDHKPDGEFIPPTTYRPTYHVTKKTEAPTGVSSQDESVDKKPQTGQDAVPVEGQPSTKRPSEVGEAVESQTPEKDEVGAQRPEAGAFTTAMPDEGHPSKPFDVVGAGKPAPEADKPETSDHPIDEGSAVPKPHGDENVPEDTQTKPQDGEESGPSHVGSAQRPTEGPHGGQGEEQHVRPQSGTRPDGKPSGEPQIGEDSTDRPEGHPTLKTPSDVDGKPETTEQSRPEFGSVATDMPEESSHPTSKRPIVDDQSLGEEHDDHKVQESVTSDRPEETLTHTKRPVDELGRPSGEPEPEHDGSATDKYHPSMMRPTQHTDGEEEPEEKPEGGVVPVGEDTATATTPVDKVEGGKPSAGTEEDVGTQKPQFGQGPAPTEEESGPQETGEPSEHEEPHSPQTGVHPTAMDTDYTLEPHGKPQTDEDAPVKPEEPAHPTSARPSDAHVEGASTEEPTHGETVPGTDDETKETDQSGSGHSTTRKPEDAGSEKPELGQGAVPTARPKPEVHGVSGQHTPQTDDIPEDAFLHPTRTPGTYETEKPEEGEDAMTEHKPSTDDEPSPAPGSEGAVRPVTRRPVHGTGKPETSAGEEGQAQPGQDRPQPSEGATSKPQFEPATDLPIDFAQIFTTFRPPFIHGQEPEEKPSYGDFQPGSGIYQRPVPEVDDVEGAMAPEATTPHGTTTPHSTTKPDDQVRPHYSVNGTHLIQYVPYKEGEVPHVPEGATLGQLQEGPNGQKYWPIIHTEPATSITTPAPSKPTPEQVFNGTHFIQYVPFKDGQEPEVPEDATLGQPQKGPDGQVYWPVISMKPLGTVPEDKPATVEPFPGQIFNGTHFIQFVPYKEGEEPEVPDEATLGGIETAPSGQKFWPIISQKPIPDGDDVGTTPAPGQPEQIFNGTHFIQYAPFNDGQEPQVPEDAVVGQPQKGPDGQIYWPVISTKPVAPSEVTTQGPSQPVHVFNGTNFIQYVPFNDGEAPEVPEGATLGQPQKGPDGQIYWPIIYMKPRPVTPQEPFPGQVFNGTNFIQYVPYKEGQKPEVPEDAILGQPQKAPDGQIYWPVVYMKPMTTTPGLTEPVTEEPFALQTFNGTHFIQYVPYTEGFEPDIPEDAILGKPERKPDGQMYWPIIYAKLPTTPKPQPDQHYPGQLYNGTHFVQYVPYRAGYKPELPEDVTLGQPQKGPDGKPYWVVVSANPLPKIQEKPIEQEFNGTHFIQYAPYTDQEPEVPEGASLGKPYTGPDGEKHWPIVYSKPVSGAPITIKPEVEETFESSAPKEEQIFNGTHFIQYVPYKPGQKPKVPEGGTLGHPEKGPGDQLFWPVIYLKPRPGVPIVTHQGPLTGDRRPIVDPLQRGQVFNGSHYIQYVPYKPGQAPEVPEEGTLGRPEKGSTGQLFWPIIYLKPRPGVPIVTLQDPLTGDHGPAFDPNGQVFNGTHYIQYLPYTPGLRPAIPQDATLGRPEKGPGGQMYWPVVYLKPRPGVPITVHKGPLGEADLEPTENGQVYNGSHYIQYVPFIPGSRPAVPEGATLGQPQKASSGQLYWPIIYLKPVPGVPIMQKRPTGDSFWSPYDYSRPRPEQFYNGTHFIQYLPYNPTQMPEVPEGATLGHPQKGPGGQMYWVLISDKPIPEQSFNGTHLVQYVTPVTPELEKPHGEDQATRPIQAFNGTHYIQYVPYIPGRKPVVPEGATLGHPERGPGGQMFWPIIYTKPLSEVSQQGPTFLAPGHDQPIPQGAQVFNGTHFIQYVPYDPAKVPQVPEGASLSKTQKGPGGQMYWVIASRKPLTPSVSQGEPFQPYPGQVFNGTHYIQYVPYNPSQMPQVPEGAILGHPQKGPEGQMYWVIISDKPLPAQPGTQYVQYVTPVTPGQQEDQTVPRPTFNGTHFIQYVPYKPHQTPKVPEDAVLGDLEKGAGGVMYWPIIFRKPPQGPIFNGTHYVQYVPYNDSGLPESARPTYEYGKPQGGRPISSDDHLVNGTKPLGRPTVNGTHHIQNVPAALGEAGDKHPFWDYGQYRPQVVNGTQEASKVPTERPQLPKPGTAEHAFWTYGQNKPQNVTSSDEKPYKPTTEGYPSWSYGHPKPQHNGTKAPAHSEGSKLPTGQYGGESSKPSYGEYESGYYKPDKRPGEDSYEAIDEDHLIEYPSGSDYDETQEQPYGPGTCRYAGKVYVSAQQIPRDDPCDFCFCFRSDIICLQQSCPPPIPGCHEEPIQGFCCPRYECHVRMATLLNVTSTTTTTTTTLPPHFLSHVYKGAAGRTGCFVQGKAYRVGQAIPSASGPCMDCICGGDGKMKCEPKVCTPEPMVRQMMASSEKPLPANER